MRKELRRRLVIRYRHYLMRLRYDAVADPYKIIEINPQNVTEWLTEYPSGRTAKWDFYGAIIDADWDKHTQPFEEREFFIAIENHFLNDVSWEEAGIIEHSHEPDRGINGYYEIDDLYQEIKEDGYQKIPRDSKIDPRKYNVVSVHVGREGDFIFSGSGNHRLSIAKILGLDAIPVRVLGRHEQWQELRDEIYKNGLPEEHEDLRDHPDLQDVLD